MQSERGKLTGHEMGSFLVEIKTASLSDLDLGLRKSSVLAGSPRRSELTGGFTRESSKRPTSSRTQKLVEKLTLIVDWKLTSFEKLFLRVSEQVVTSFLRFSPFLVPDGTRCLV